MLIILAIAVGGPVCLIFLLLASAEKSLSRSIDYASSVALAHDVKEIITDGSWTAGIDPGTRTLVVIGSKGAGYRFTYDHVASVELTPIYSHYETGNSATTTNRGSQIVSAGVGAAIAGPAGLVVGGLSGSKSTTHNSVSTTELDRLELKIRLYFDELPVVKIVASKHSATEAERLAARLANVIDQRDCIPKSREAPGNIETELLTHEQARGQNGIVRRGGWWSRTFGS